MASQAALISETFNQFAPLSEKYWKVGSNTGNVLFYSSLNSMLDCDIVPGWQRERLGNYDRLITTEFIWIQEGAKPIELYNYWLKNLSNALVPISIGLQASEFKQDFSITPEMCHILSAAQERATLFVRGEYTAGILEKHGIKNLVIVGCPSVYQLPLFQSGFNYLLDHSSQLRTVGNYKTFVHKLNQIDDDLISYLSQSCHAFVEQTLAPLNNTNFQEKDYVKWYERNTHLFFDLESWVRFMSQYDFSLGARFHGNVSALLGGLRALFITVDSRTQEMVNHFDFPSIKAEKFDTTKNIDFYYQLADYTGFVRNYEKRMHEFCAALAQNNLALRSHFKEKLDAFEFGDLARASR